MNLTIPTASPLNPIEELEAFRQYLDGKDVEEWHPGFNEHYVLCPSKHWGSHVAGFRHRPIAVPEPKPWTQEDVPPGALFRSRGQPDFWYSIAKISLELITLNTTVQGSYSFTELASNWEWSTDLKTWRACTK